MKLTKEARDEYKRIYLKTRGIKLTDEQADQMGWKLLELAVLTLRNQEPGA